MVTEILKGIHHKSNQYASRGLINTFWSRAKKKCIFKTL